MDSGRTELFVGLAMGNEPGAMATTPTERPYVAPPPPRRPPGFVAALRASGAAR